MTADMLSPRLREIADDFAAVGEADRLQLLLEFSDELPGLPERYAADRSLLEPVPECQSPLFLAVEVDADNTVRLFFDVPRQAPSTRGFAGVLHAGLDGMSAGEVLATPGDFTDQLGLQHLVSPLRRRGMAAMLARIKRQIRDKSVLMTVRSVGVEEELLLVEPGAGQPRGNGSAFQRSTYRDVSLGRMVDKVAAVTTRQ
jgi:cysteine desulfuration protein SufE